MDAPLRLSMNQATVPSWSTVELLDGCARAGYRSVGLWRDPVIECGVARAAKLAAANGLRVTSLCRAGFFLAADPAAQEERRVDNRRAVDEAAELGADVLVLVCGPGTDKDLDTARRRVAEEMAEMAAYAAECGVTLGIEPMHPVYCGDRSVVVTLAQAVELLGAPGLGAVRLVVDSYHLWWDPELTRSLEAAAGRIAALQLADWLAPPPHPLNGRGMLGDGSIDLRQFRERVDGVGYSGPIEVEIFNPEIWAMEPAAVLELTAARYREHVE